MSIRSKLLLLLVLCAAGFGCLFIVNMLGNDRTRAMSELRDLAVNAQLHVLQARRQEKNFLIHGEARHMENAMTEISSISAMLRDIADHSPSDAKEVRALEAVLAGYGDAFQSLINAQQIMGSLESGAEHDFVMAARALEKALHGETDMEVLVSLLQLRRQEKNYQLRNTEEYARKVQANAAVVRQQLAGHPEMLRALDEYERTFALWTQSRKQRGGAAQQLVAFGRELEPGITALKQEFGTRRARVQ